MPKKDEEKRRKEAEALAIEIALNEEQLKKRAAEDALAPKKLHKGKSEAKFAPLSTAKGNDWKKILDEYTKQYQTGPNKAGALVFPTMNDAVKFFTTQAEAGLTFFATQYENGKPVDFHLFSCGDKHLYQGTYAEIKAQLEEACKKDPDNELTTKGLEEFISYMPSTTPNPASEMRERIKGHRQTAEDSAELSSTPAPTATTRR